MGAVRSVVAAGLIGATVWACGGPEAHGITQPVQNPPVPFMPRVYRLTDVMKFAYPDTAYGVRMNDRNEIIANVQDPALVGHANPVIWRNGSMTAMSGCAWAYQINARGQVLCYTSPGVGLWQDGALTRLGGTDSLVPDNYYAAVLNDSGDVAGGKSRYCADCPGTTYLLRAGHMSVLDPPLPPPFFPFHIARINNAGAVLVSDGRGGYSTDAYVVSGGQLLETFDIGIGSVSDMNDAGQIVGTALGHPGNPIVLTRHVANFPKLFGTGNSINNREQVVGQLIFPTFPSGDVGDPSAEGPFYWDRISGVYKLQKAATDSAWTITHALQINNAGAILATGFNASLGASIHLVVLVPVQ